VGSDERRRCEQTPPASHLPMLGTLQFEVAFWRLRQKCACPATADMRREGRPASSFVPHNPLPRTHGAKRNAIRGPGAKARVSDSRMPLRGSGNVAHHAGEIALNYGSLDARFAGVRRALLQALERTRGQTRQRQMHAAEHEDLTPVLSRQWLCRNGSRARQIRQDKPPSRCLSLCRRRSSGRPQLGGNGRGGRNVSRNVKRP
jgi:hypothetical protein